MPRPRYHIIRGKMRNVSMRRARVESIEGAHKSSTMAADLLPVHSAKAVQAHDGLERAALIESFSRIARYMARKYRHWSIDDDDLFQTAMIAVIESVDAYDPTRGLTMPQFIFYRVRQALNHLVMRLRRQERPGRPIPGERPDPGPGPDDDGDDFSELWHCIDSLPYLERATIIARFGFDNGGKPRARKALAARLQVGKPMAAYLETRSLEALREALMA